MSHLCEWSQQMAPPLPYINTSKWELVQYENNCVCCLYSRHICIYIVHIYFRYMFCVCSFSLLSDCVFLCTERIAPQFCFVSSKILILNVNLVNSCC